MKDMRLQHIGFLVEQAAELQYKNSLWPSDPRQIPYIDLDEEVKEVYRRQVDETLRMCLRFTQDPTNWGRNVWYIGG